MAASIQMQTTDFPGHNRFSYLPLWLFLNFKTNPDTYKWLVFIDFQVAKLVPKRPVSYST